MDLPQALQAWKPYLVEDPENRPKKTYLGKRLEHLHAILFTHLAAQIPNLRYNQLTVLTAPGGYDVLGITTTPNNYLPYVSPTSHWWANEEFRVITAAVSEYDVLADSVELSVAQCTVALYQEALKGYRSRLRGLQNPP